MAQEIMESVATFEEMKDEAVRRMRAVKYFNPSIREFSENNRIMVNCPPYGAHYYIDDFDDDGTDATERYRAERLEALEKIREWGYLPYAAIIQITNIGYLTTILYVSKYKEEWDMEFEAWEDKPYFTTFSYVINHDDLICSEFGDVTVMPTIAGGLKRVY